MTIKDNYLALSNEEKNQLQLERLQSTLNRAFRNVPFHRNRFKEMGIDISQIESLGDIARLPFMERKHFSENYPYDLFAVPLREIIRIHTAPGTMENPTVSGYTAQDLKTWEAILARALTASNVTFHDILQLGFHPGLANWGRDYKRGAEAIEASVIPNTQLSIEKKLMVLRDYKTSVLVTTPSSANQLAAYIAHQEININSLELKALILAGEAIDNESRKKLEETLQVTVWLNYGLSEVPGPAIGFECIHHEGLHVNEDHFLSEIIDPQSGKALPDGHFGELALTTLTTRAFPLIRLKTGDRARIVKDRCACGIDLKRIEWTGERTDDLMNIDGVNINSRQIRLNIAQQLGIDQDSARFFVAVRDEKKILEVWLPVDERLFSDEIKVLEKIIRQAEERLLENLGIPVLIRLKEKQALLDNKI
jgi:phenylacetate-CoA ligase